MQQRQLLHLSLWLETPLLLLLLLLLRNRGGPCATTNSSADLGPPAHHKSPSFSALLLQLTGVCYTSNMSGVFVAL